MILVVQRLAELELSGRLEQSGKHKRDMELDIDEREREEEGKDG